jgi:ubiquinone/menaquinone biosynthesis C-methylase UbiE
MPDNTARFSGRAADYDRYRQRYPTVEILSRLQAWCGLTPSWLVADVGAGTGMLAEVFLKNENRIFAIEPNQDMRDRMRACVEQHLGHPTPALEILDATAEATTLPTASIDLVAAGRAFHWFDRDRALAEFRRILKPSGWVALVAVDRDRDSKDPAYRPQIDAYEEMMSTHGVDYTGVVRSGYRIYDKPEMLFGGEFHHDELPGLRRLDWTTFRGHTMSLSVSPQPGHANHDAFQQALRRYFDTYSRDGIFTMPTICWITVARFHPGARVRKPSV